MISRSISELLGLTHGVLIFIGSGKVGKSCTAHTMTAMFWPDRVKCMYDPRGHLRDHQFPGYMIAKTLDEIPKRCVVFFEDATRFFPSRISAKDAALQEWVGSTSHKDIVMIVTVQNTADIDMALFRAQNTIFCHKLMHDEDVEYERDERVQDQIDANRILREHYMQFPKVDWRAWVYLSRYNEVLAFPVISWWGREHSHMLEDVRVCS